MAQQPECALSAQLADAGEAQVEHLPGLNARQAVAALVWRLLTDGWIALPNPDDKETEPRKLTLDTAGWLALVKWLYAQVDGPPPRPTAAKEDGGDALNSFLDGVAE